MVQLENKSAVRLSKAKMMLFFYNIQSKIPVDYKQTG